MKIPEGTTHFIPADSTDFNQVPDFMKWGYAFTGPETGKHFFCWYYWNCGLLAWVKDLSFVDRHNKLKPIRNLIGGGA